MAIRGKGPSSGVVYLILLDFFLVCFIFGLVLRGWGVVGPRFYFIFIFVSVAWLAADDAHAPPRRLQRSEPMAVANSSYAAAAARAAARSGCSSARPPFSPLAHHGPLGGSSAHLPSLGQSAVSVLWRCVRPARSRGLLRPPTVLYSSAPPVWGADLGPRAGLGLAWVGRIRRRSTEVARGDGWALGA